MLASVRAELGSSTRDLTPLVNQVTSILPQFSDDAVCEALVQVDEDVERAVEFLLARPIVVKPQQTKAKKASAASPQLAPQAAPSNATGASSSGGRPPARDAGGASTGKQKQRKEKEKPAPRNIEHLVQQVLGILPQCGEEAAREALEAREDVQHTVETLLVRMMNDGKSVKVRAADSTEAGLFDIEEREARPKTTGEKEVQKLTKKMREIERIEEKLRLGEKVDPLQLPKLDKKAELTGQLNKAEADGKAEVEKVEADERQQLQSEREAALQAVRSAVADLKAKNPGGVRPPMAPAPTEPPVYAAAPAYSPEAPYTPPTSPPTASPAPPPQNAKAKAGAALLNMLHGNKAKGGYQQSADLAKGLSGGQKGKGAPQAAATNEEEEDDDDDDGEGWTKVEGGSPQHSSKQPAPRWSDEEVQGGRDSFNLNEYSTPINQNMTWEQREHAERIAKEIEGNHSYVDRQVKGKGGKDAGGAKGDKGYRSERRDDYGKGKEKGKDDRKGGGKRDDRGGKGDRRGKDDRPRQDDRRGKGAPAGPPAERDDAPTRSSRVFEGLPSPQRPPPKDDDGDSPSRLRSSPKARPAAPPPQRMEASRLNW